MSIGFYKISMTNLGSWCNQETNPLRGVIFFLQHLQSNCVSRENMGNRNLTISVSGGSEHQTPKANRMLKYIMAILLLSQSSLHFALTFVRLHCTIRKQSRLTLSLVNFHNIFAVILQWSRDMHEQQNLQRERKNPFDSEKSSVFQCQEEMRLPRRGYLKGSQIYIYKVWFLKVWALM